MTNQAELPLTLTQAELEVLAFVRDGEPDAKLPAHLNYAAERLIELGLLVRCGCSDGDYLERAKE